jgi:hypothetical protein
MMGGKSNSLTRMYLAGLQAQSSVYGSTIPVIYGVTKTTPLLIWLPGEWLRAGAGLGQKKSKSKGGTNYINNADFLIGHNPIAGVLRMWYNNAGRGLNFVKYSHVWTSSSGGFSLTIPDSNFYFLLAVTADVNYGVTFNDYGGQGSETLTGTFEMPLWNVNYAGPDPTNQSGYRNFPAVYQWIPYSGPTVNFPAGAVLNIPNLGTNLHFYYAQLVGGVVPCTSLRLTFEPQLGDGSSYGDSGEQIIYPPYAGLWSTDLDMGAGGAAPAIAQETAGSFLINPPYGDADYADMIEDIFKSGPAQAGTGAAVAYGDIHHGLACLDFPGTIQKKYVFGGVFGFTQATYDLPNTAGNILIAAFTSINTGPTLVSDTAGNEWTPLVTGTTVSQVWYCVAKAAQSNTITFGGALESQAVLIEIGGLDTIDSTAVTVVSPSSSFSGSVTNTNKPGEDALSLSFILYETGGIQTIAVPTHWNRIVAANQGVNQAILVDSRATKHPGTYPLAYAGVAGISGATIVTISLKNSQPNTFTSPLGNILDDATMQVARNQARAYGLIGSLNMDSQKKGSDWLTELYQALNAAPVWSGDVLKSIAYAEESAVGNGAIYTSPTASGPIANLTENDFIAEGTDPPVTVERSAQVDAPNLQQIQCPVRTGDISNAADYAASVVAEPDNASMSLYGTRKDSPKVFQSIQSTAVARMILGIMVRTANIVRNSYKFKVQAKWALLEAMDLVKVPIQSTMPAIDPETPISGTITVRLTSVSVDDKFGVDCEAEPFIFGMRTPNLLTSSVPAPSVPDTNVDPGLVNTPIFFEATPGLSGQSINDILWIITSNANSAGIDPSGNPYSLYGGCIPMISTDGGASYNPILPTPSSVFGNATTGFTVGDWPAAADPDTTNDLSVDLTQSLGVLDAYSVAEEDNFLFPCYVAGGGGNSVPYELMAYGVANLTAAYKYTLKATGGGTNHLRRAVFGAPDCERQGVDHPNGSRFAFLDPADSAQPGVLRMTIPKALIGVTLYFKFLAFNIFGGGLQSLTEATAYSYTPTGIISSSFQEGLAPTAPGNFIIGYCSALPAQAIIIQMTSGGAIWSQSPTLFDSANIYLVASDAGITGIAVVFTAAPDAVLSLAPGASGNFSVAHGLAATPALALVQMTAPVPSAIWSQATEIDATNINLFAVDAASTGKCYVWLSPPKAPGSSFAEVALAPSAAGNFTVAHGLGKAPTLVIVRMKSGGAIWLQSPASDATNLYLAASDGGVTGVAEIWHN